ncbi:MAG TPA: hypothetical protein VE988_22665, partial [Gemmataceae bacterium]|nr:hypothetical protein [Gemmataceae bacterium]
MSGNVEFRRPYGGEEGYKVDFSHDDNGYICARVKVTPTYAITPTVVALVYDDPEAIPEPDHPPTNGVAGLLDTNATESDIWLIPGDQHLHGIPGAVVDTDVFPGSPNYVAV